MTIKDILEKLRAKKERFKEAQFEDKIQHTIQERKKNANERELERYHEEERQEMIKKELEHYRSKKRREMWTGNTVLKGKYMFHDEKPILKTKNIFKNKENILRQKPMFMIGGKNGL